MCSSSVPALLVWVPPNVCTRLYASSPPLEPHVAKQPQDGPSWLIVDSNETPGGLASTDVTRYVEFKQITGSFVQQGKDSRATVERVPANATDAAYVATRWGIMTTYRVRNFFTWIGDYFDKSTTTDTKGEEDCAH